MGNWHRDIKQVAQQIARAQMPDGSFETGVYPLRPATVVHVREGAGPPKVMKAPC